MRALLPPLPPREHYRTAQKFGDLHGNGCGFINKGPGEESIADLPYPIDAVAAVADFDPRCGPHPPSSQPCQGHRVTAMSLSRVKAMSLPCHSAVSRHSTYSCIF